MAERDAAPAAVPRKHGTGSLGAPPAGRALLPDWRKPFGKQAALEKTGCQELAEKGPTGGSRMARVNARPRVEDAAMERRKARRSRKRAPETKMWRQPALHPPHQMRGKTAEAPGGIGAAGTNSRILHYTCSGPRLRLSRAGTPQAKP